MAIIVTVISQPANGTATVQPDNQIEYVPNLGFVGFDSFTYQFENTLVIDPSNVATVNICVGGLTVQITKAPLYGTLDVDPLTNEVTYINTQVFSGVDEYSWNSVDLDCITESFTVIESFSGSYAGTLPPPVVCAPGQDDHYQEQAQDLMLNQFCDSTDLISIFRTKAKHYDLINDLLIFINGGFDINTACGWMLDLLGARFACPREIEEIVNEVHFGFADQEFTAPFGLAPFIDNNGIATKKRRLTDSEYRDIIKIKMSLINADTSIIGVARMIELIYKTDVFQIINAGESAINVYLQPEDDDETNILPAIFKKSIVAAGIDLKILFKPLTGTFGFDDQQITGSETFGNGPFYN